MYTVGLWIINFPPSVLVLPDEPVTGTPSISLISNFIIYRWTIYIKSIFILRLMESHLWFKFVVWNRWKSLYRSQAHGVVFFDLYGTLVTSSKNWSLVWTGSKETSNFILVYALGLERYHMGLGPAQSHYFRPFSKK